MNWFYDTSILITLPLFVGGFVLLSCLAVLWLRPVVRRLVDSPSEWDRALAHVIGTFGVFFGILLALVALSVYENFAVARRATLAEAAHLTALYRGTTALPPEVGEPLLDTLGEYVHAVVELDFPDQKQGVQTADGLGCTGGWCSLGMRSHENSSFSGWHRLSHESNNIIL